ncbi:MAG TPA: hypothetical protein VFA10_26060 [Ktedonobacteraceae bacterium]|nr:hypothetical protein [Ktedonobacteraceae bacterium]
MKKAILFWLVLRLERLVGILLSFGAFVIYAIALAVIFTAVFNNTRASLAALPCTCFRLVTP